jgi:hypothetical protein
MVEPITASGPQKCVVLADAVNRWLRAMTIRPATDQDFELPLDVGVIGYRTDQKANPIIQPAWTGPLVGTTLASIAAVRKHSLGTGTSVRRAESEVAGESIEISPGSPFWVEPLAEGSTPMCHVLHFGHGVLCQWLRDHPQGSPPVVVHITDGESQDGDPLPYADAVRNLGTTCGNTLFLNCHLSTTSPDPVLFPSSEAELPDGPARQLFGMSSVLPEPVWHAAVAAGFGLDTNARGMVYNADPNVLLRFLGLGPTQTD